ncbi:MAG: hypothetical protein GXO88_15185 [Chlorobi bacterium]|nr:hypothetical protein [Chlorobiota bacterium]
MKRYNIILAFVLAISLQGFGQHKNDSVPEIGLGIIANVNQGNSYITFPTDLGNLEPLWFEGNIIPNFLIRQSKNSRVMGVLTPQIIIRMYQEESMPVRTPSYIPQITLYYRIDALKSNSRHTLFGRFAHHSNGQAGNFYLPNGEINLKTGNFSTNFFEIGLIYDRSIPKLNAEQFLISSLEVHPLSWSIDELEGLYSPLRWHGTFSIYKMPFGKKNSKNKRAKISFRTEAIWMFGDINQWKDFSLKRLNFDFIFYYHPRFLEDIGFFIQYYNGMDYYNIYFNEKRKVLRFGIMTSKLKF